MPNVPLNFNNTRQYPSQSNTTITLEWNVPQGLGSRRVVDYYVVTVSPALPSLPDNEFSVNSTSLNVTLLHNVNYTLSVTAINCAGASDMAILSNALG